MTTAPSHWWSPVQWQDWLGFVYVTRLDRQPVTVEEVLQLWAFCTHLCDVHQAVIEGQRGPVTIQDVNKQAFEQFKELNADKSTDYWREKAMCVAFLVKRLLGLQSLRSNQLSRSELEQRAAGDFVS